MNRFKVRWVDSVGGDVLRYSGSFSFGKFFSTILKYFKII